jgi:hypothetical protein
MTPPIIRESIEEVLRIPSMYGKDIDLEGILWIPFYIYFSLEKPEFDWRNEYYLLMSKTFPGPSCRILADRISEGESCLPFLREFWVSNR